MKWTDRIGIIKVALIICAAILAIVSLVVSHGLVKDLEREEHGKMQVWAEAMRTLSVATDNTDLNLVLQVINGNNTIPVIVTDKAGNVQLYRNVNVNADNHADSLRAIAVKANELKASGRSIRVAINDYNRGDYVSVCYDDSLLLKRLEVYPFVQLGVVSIFVVVAIFAILVSKRAEQNKVWVGLSKETAHQLGTPISSLMAWVEILKENYPTDSLIPELDSDVKRLQLIADRFSKIGSLPEIVPANLVEIINHVADYMNRRTSSKVEIIKHFSEENIPVKLNSQLFEWVIENLCKNAVDAMSGKGTITINVERLLQKTIIDVTDTGKGIRKKDLRHVFSPGFTTKERGWGLGLSLAKRIIEEYHHGKIFLKSSEIGKGTTFRIEL